MTPGLSIIALAVVVFCASAPSAPLLLLDVLDVYATDQTLDIGACVRDRARERAGF